MNVVSVVVAALKSNAAITREMVGKMEVDIMLVFGSSVSLIQEGVATDFLGEKIPSPVGLTLVSAAGEDIPVPGLHYCPIRDRIATSQPLIDNNSVFNCPSNIGSELPAEAQIGVGLCIKSGQNQFIHRSLHKYERCKTYVRHCKAGEE